MLSVEVSGLPPAAAGCASSSRRTAERSRIARRPSRRDVWPPATRASFATSRRLSRRSRGHPDPRRALAARREPLRRAWTAPAARAGRAPAAPRRQRPGGAHRADDPPFDALRGRRRLDPALRLLQHDDRDLAPRGADLVADVAREEVRDQRPPPASLGPGRHAGDPDDPVPERIG